MQEITNSYKKYGNGKTVLILHGLFGMLDNWHSFAKLLSKDYEVYIIDLRNHGRSTKTNNHSYKLMSNDIFNFVQKHNINKVSIIGHSMGGKLAIKFATLHPKLVEKLVIIDILPIKYELLQEHKIIFKAIDFIDSNDFYNRKKADLKLSEIVNSMKLRIFLIKNLTKDKSGKIIWKFNSVALKQNIQNILGSIKIENKIQIPTLFIKAGKSDYIFKDKYNSIKASFENSKIIEIKDSTHWVHVDKAEKLLNILTNFLK
ncbi:MAG: alpha/beta fold hydrolase [Bacteroidota bacterium]|nr:alpha/beta fold hydrolase [Bacteroidota bacterium]